MAAIEVIKPMSKNDVADVLGVSLRTVENWVNDGTLPAPAKLGNRCYWHPASFYEWLDRRLRGDAIAPPVPADAEEQAPSSDPAAVTPVPVAAGPARPTKLAGKRAASVDRMRAKDQAELQSLMA